MRVHPLSIAAALRLSLPFRPNWLALACVASLGVPLAQAQTPPDAGLREVVVTGARSERALEDVPARIDVIQGEDLDAAQVQDLSLIHI